MLTERETRGNYPHTNTAASNGQMDAPKHWKNTPIKSVWRWIDALWHLFPQQRGTEVFLRANITYKIKKFRRLMVRELPRQEDIWKAISSKYRRLLSLGLRKYLKDWKDFDDNTYLPLQNKHATLRKKWKNQELYLRLCRVFVILLKVKVHDCTPFKKKTEHIWLVESCFSLCTWQHSLLEGSWIWTNNNVLWTEKPEWRCLTITCSATFGKNQTQHISNTSYQHSAQ